MVRQVAITNVLLLVYSLMSYIELFLGALKKPTLWRSIISACDYSLLTMILVSIIMVVYPGHKKYLFLPGALNIFMVILSIPTGIVFSYSDNNVFQRGVFGYMPYFLNGIYLAYLLLRVYKSLRWDKSEIVHLIYMAAVAVVCMIMPLLFKLASDQWFITTISVELLLYYVFLLQRYTKRDPLTGLFNRQCYYADIDKFDKNLTALIAIDMNGLKQINDGSGHTKGDAALKAVSKCFLEATSYKHHVYRIGGDEFVILCLSTDERDVKVMVSSIERHLADTTYSCSTGYAMRSEGMSVDELYREADKMLYQSKRKFYEEKGIDRRRERRKERTENVQS